MTVTILGLGLIGGSIALSLKENKFADLVIGVDSNIDHILTALDLRIVDKVMRLSDAIAQADIIILAIPVDMLSTMLPHVLNLISENQVVIDVGSTKKIIIDKIKSHPKRRNFIATHPMAGTEFSGPKAAIPNLFTNKNCVLCDVDDSKPELVEIIENMYTNGLKMKVMYLESTSHDVHTAYISHISHICSFALASTVLAKEENENNIFNLASTGFESTVRLAKSNPETWIPIFRQNQQNIIEVMDEYINTLHSYRNLMLAGDYEVLKKMLWQANQIKYVLS
ncbi:prephenate dehydrogenase [Arcicella aurantiaca]|uniref:Prephenate dehydrogenase n=1 Tax=Arcicella aurantiaca TaxID=591202 RepID=A0A316ELH4_9BACT|nr:prephenate dehydrogenase [Arcicella aurantiaca]PWK23810.1 prephenate dehydrogenase [Arcicella aurantiaca]